jgi:hypothetical protein
MSRVAFSVERVLLVLCSCFIAFMVTVKVSQNQAFINLQMNADMLASIAFIWDIQNHGYAWMGTKLNDVPSFFPDLTLYWMLDAAIGSRGWVQFAYALSQFVLLSYAGGWITRLISGVDVFRAAFVVGSLYAGILLIETCFFTGINAQYDFLLPGIHSGPFIVSLAMAGMSCMLLERWRLHEAVVLYILLTLAVLSDKLLIFEFIIPVIVGAIIVGSVAACSRLYGSITRAYMLSCVIAAGFFTACLIDGQLNKDHEPSIPDIQMIPIDIARSSFWSSAGTYIQSHFLSVLLCIIVPMLFLLFSPLFIRNLEKEQLLRAAFLWVYSIVALTLVTIAVSLLYGDAGSIRYIAPVLYLPLPFVVAVVLHAWKFRNGFGVQALMGGSLIPGSVTWKIPLTSCLHDLGARYGFQAGIANYWVAFPLMIASDQTIQILHVAGDGSPELGHNDRFWYTKSFVESSRLPAYGFVVMDFLDGPSIRRRYGLPNRIERCAQQESSEIWIYKDSKRFYENLRAGVSWL